MNIMTVDCKKIDGIWDKIAPNVKRVLDTQNKHNAVSETVLTIEQTKEHIRAGNGLLLAVIDDNEVIASLMIEVLKTEVGRSLNITTLAGNRINEWNMMLLQTLKNLAKHYKCDDIRIYIVRPGWVRAMKRHGFKFIGTRNYCGIDYPVISYKMSRNYAD